MPEPDLPTERCVVYSGDSRRSTPPYTYASRKRLAGGRAATYWRFRCGSIDAALPPHRRGLSAMTSLAHTPAGDTVTSLDEYKGEVIPSDAREQMIERAARAIYAKRPFKTAARRSPWEPGTMHAETFDWDSAPAYYQQDCREIATVAIDAALPGRDGEHDLEMGCYGS